MTKKRKAKGAWNVQDVKILFFDIDGTLIDMDRKQISEKMLETLIRLKEKGLLLCVATGRGPMGVPHFPGVEFDACLTYNGACCFSGQHMIYSSPIPTEDVKQIIKNASRINRPVSVATKDRLLSNGRDKDLEDYYAISKAELIVSEDFDDVVDREEIYQLMLGCRERDYPELLRNVRSAKIAAWWKRAADIIPAAAGKGNGIQKILEYYHLDAADAIAFGDGNNDIEMFHAVGTGVAVENASEQLKAEADEVCGHVAEDGIYYYCLERGMI